MRARLAPDDTPHPERGTARSRRSGRLPMRAVPRRVAAVLVVVALAGVARGAAATPLLQRIVLTPAQVGAGYRMRMLPQGDVVKNQVSLDLCDFAFPSD